MRRAIYLSAALLSVVAAPAAAFAEVPAAVAPGHVPEPSGLYEGAMHGYTPNTVTGGTVINTGKLGELIDTEHPLLLDVAEKDRKPPNMDKDMVWLPTHRSIPGAVFLQGGGQGDENNNYSRAFASRVASLTAGSKAKPIVTFCHPDCWGSYNAAKRLVGLGYTKVYWYREGVEGWQADHETRSVKPDAIWLNALSKDVTQ